MTDTQKQIQDQVTELLSEHFEGYVLILQAVEDNNETRSVSFDGGKSNAIGLLAQASHELLSSKGEDDGQEY
jgi:hypothetical protein